MDILIETGFAFVAEISYIVLTHSHTETFRRSDKGARNKEMLTEDVQKR